MIKANLETIKEIGRIALFAAITGVLGWLTTLVSDLDPNSTYYIVGTVVLRLIDKWVHENEDMESDGIAPF